RSTSAESKSSRSAVAFWVTVILARLDGRGRENSSGAPTTRSHARQVAEPEALEAAGEQAAHLRLEQRPSVPERLVDSCRDHVGEQLGVVGVDRLRVDLDLQDLAARGRGDLDRAAAGGRRDGLAGGLLLQALELL